MENRANVDDTQAETKGASDFNQWSLFAWKLIKSLAIVVAGTTVMYFICRWLIY